MRSDICGITSSSSVILAARCKHVSATHFRYLVCTYSYDKSMPTQSGVKLSEHSNFADLSERYVGSYVICRSKVL